jgi:hypothetical protein
MLILQLEKDFDTRTMHAPEVRWSLAKKILLSMYHSEIILPRGHLPG